MNRTSKATRNLFTALIYTLAISSCTLANTQNSGIRDVDGASLPPKSTSVASSWPPTFKRFLDEGLAIFTRGGNEPGIAEIEAKLDIRLTPDINIYPSSGILRKYQVSSSAFGLADSALWGQQLVVLGKPNTQQTTWRMKVFLDPKQICVNPYDVAIYLGESFMETDGRVHAKTIDVWPLSYTWGMFKRGSQGEHASKSLSITTAPQLPNQPHTDPDCITSLTLFGKFNKV